MARIATAQEETLCTAGQDELCENLNPSQGLDARTRVCVLGAELKMELANCERIKMLGPNLATCQLAARDENAVKLELKLSDENGRRKQTKTRWGWGGKHNRNDMESVN